MGVIMQSELGLVFVSIIMGDPEISLVSRLKNHLIFLKKYIKNTRRLIENDKKLVKNLLKTLPQIVF